MKQLETKPIKTFIARCEQGEDLYSCLTKLVLDNNILSGSFQAIGAVSQAKVGVFEHGKYEWVDHKGALEISSCIGNISVKEGKHFVHCHAVFSNEKGTILAGHVAEGCIADPTAEIHIQVYEGEVQRKYDDKTGLWILDI